MKEGRICNEKIRFMYQVIFIFDELREKSYFGSYFISENTELGNITCEELPPFADINKAHACYWNAEEKQWVFDSERYSEIMEQLTVEKEAAEKAEAEAKAKFIFMVSQHNK